MLHPPCWEILQCGREIGGWNEMELGPCPASPQHGHSCWLVAGTLCKGVVQGTFAQKQGGCLQCEVYRRYNLCDGTEREALLRDHPDEAAKSLSLFLSR